MSFLRILLFSTVAANIVLGVLWWRHCETAHEQPLPSPAIYLPESSLPPAGEIWTDDKLGSFITDASLSDVDLVARLRAGGLPVEVIRLIMSQRVHRNFASRWQAFVDQASNLPYWTPYRGVPSDLRRQIMLLDREERAALIDLLGDDAIGPSDNINWVVSNLDYLPRAKQLALEQTLADFDDLQISLTAEAMGILTRSDRDVLTYLEQEREAEIRALLTPDEYADFQRRSSRSAAAVQARLRFFDATEEEYTALLKLYEASPLQSMATSARGSVSRDDNRAIDAAWATVLQQFAAGLPADRTADLTATLDRGFITQHRFGLEHGLGPNTALELTRLNRTVSERQTALQTDSSLTIDQRDAALATLLAQADQRLAQLLPTDARAEYLNTAAGRILSNLRLRLHRP